MSNGPRYYKQCLTCGWKCPVGLMLFTGRCPKCSGDHWMSLNLPKESFIVPDQSVLDACAEKGIAPDDPVKITMITDIIPKPQEEADPCHEVSSPSQE